MDEFTFDSAVRGYHVCQDVWKPAAGENLHAEQEFDNLMDKFEVKVTKSSETVGHMPREYSRISWYFRGGKCKLKFWLYCTAVSRASLVFRPAHCW